jgi:peptidyl-prolyl cis-trans isomerase SurA
MFSRRLFVFAGVGLAGACVRHAWSQQAADAVDGEPITEADIRNRLRLLEATSPQHRPPAREVVIDELRNDRRILQEANRKGIKIADADIDAAVAGMAARMHMTAQQFDDQLAKAGLDLGDYKQKLRAVLARRALGLPP